MKPEAKLRTGLLGAHLSHSFSPRIHAALATYSYELFEKEEGEVGDFLKNGDFDAINVTIPYKKTVMPYLDEISDEAKRIGAVNTVVRREDGNLWGHNTDYEGFPTLWPTLASRLRAKRCWYWARAVPRARR